ncbi:MAG: ferredoxin [Candidatus Brocadiae bacterium]|nr:ferredoxin [Candidatus Brocadiia bacterium]
MVISMNKREFLKNGLRLLAGVALCGGFALLAKKSQSKDFVWQLDPYKCVQCGRCATHCVLSVSAVKCIHAYNVCGYCKLCGGYYQPYSTILDTAAENQLCPTKAIRRTFIEDPYYEYSIDESVCIGCGKCVKGCGAFGNGSLFLQVRHNLCLGCNECSIAQACPAKAFQKVPSSHPYLLKGK